MVKARKMCYYAFKVSTSLVCSFVFRLRGFALESSDIVQEQASTTPFSRTAAHKQYTLYNIFRVAVQILMSEHLITDFHDEK